MAPVAEVAGGALGRKPWPMVPLTRCRGIEGRHPRLDSLAIHRFMRRSLWCESDGTTIAPRIQSSSHPVVAVVERTLRPSNEQMIAHVITFSAGMVEAASLLETESILRDSSIGDPRATKALARRIPLAAHQDSHHRNVCLQTSLEFRHGIDPCRRHTQSWRLDINRDQIHGPTPSSSNLLQIYAPPLTGIRNSLVVGANQRCNSHDPVVASSFTKQSR